MTTVCLTGFERSGRKKVEGDETAVMYSSGEGLADRGAQIRNFIRIWDLCSPKPAFLPCSESSGHTTSLLGRYAARHLECVTEQVPMRPDSFRQPCPMPTRTDVTEANFARRKCPSWRRRIESSSNGSQRACLPARPQQGQAQGEAAILRLIETSGYEPHSAGPCGPLDVLSCSSSCSVLEGGYWPSSRLQQAVKQPCWRGSHCLGCMYHVGGVLAPRVARPLLNLFV